jgi:phosphoenolpyruvate-protein kinase (PTS system EI component)
MENNETTTGVETPAGEVNTTNTANAEYEAEIKRLKDALSKSNSENADWKRKYNSKLTEEEQGKALQEERDAYIKSLEQKVAKTELGAELSKGISDSKVVDSVVDDLINGNHSDAIKKINKYIEDRVANAIKEHDADLLRSNPVPPPTTETSGLTQEQFDAMSVAEKTALFRENRETYNKFMNKE